MLLAPKLAYWGMADRKMEPDVARKPWTRWLQGETKNGSIARSANCGLPCVFFVSISSCAFLRVGCADFLCALSANKHQIEFLEFTISDYATKNIIFMVREMPRRLFRFSFGAPCVFVFLIDTPRCESRRFNCSTILGYRHKKL